jgi:sirohydrochlorin ferrochelatase
VLLAVAHGSRDPAAVQAVHALAARVAGLAPGLAVRAVFVQHAQPSLADALTQAAGLDSHPAGTVVRPGRAAAPHSHPGGAAAGHRTWPAGAAAVRAAAVPLLLSEGYHLSRDIGGAAARAGIPVAGPLGPDPWLVPALADRLAAAGVPPGTPVVLAGAGSADPRAAAAVRSQAALLSAHLQVPVQAAFAAAGLPTVPQAVASLATRTGGPVAVASYLLAPGVFQARLRASGATWTSAPLGDHPAVAALVAERFQAVTGLALVG